MGARINLTQRSTYGDQKWITGREGVSSIKWLQTGPIMAAVAKDEMLQFL